MVSYSPVNLKKYKSDTLIVHCCDHAFRKPTERPPSKWLDFMIF